MGFRDLSLKKTYSSDTDDILNDFYIPALSECIEYDRIAGFFSSTSLAIAARGILGLIKNNGTMKLLVSPKLDEKDIKIIKDATENPQNYVERRMVEELEKLEDEFIRDHIFALGWMIANKRLEIKVAIVSDEDGQPLSFDEIQLQGVFHQKIGILKDIVGDILTFSGSINESASGWLKNIEEFKVFRKWIKEEKEYVEADILKFERFWNNKASRIIVMEVPEAVKRKLIEIAPKNIDEVYLQRWYLKKGEKKKEIEFYPHQKDAIQKWFNNDMKGIFEMATGLGKTFAALGCLKKVMENYNKTIAVITCPSNHLIRQWINDIDEFGLTCEYIVADSSNPDWKDKLSDSLIDIKIGIENNLIVLTTHATFHTDNFIKIIRSANEKLFLIVDEVHGIGAPKRKRGLLDLYHFRLGLSATPKRWFDLEGTETLFNYFGGTVFEFSLKDAVNTLNPATGKTYLVPYEYKPYFVELNKEELERYESVTKKIAKSYYSSKTDNERKKWFSLLCVKRQEIIKNAIKKYDTFKKIIEEMGKNIKHCLVYCSPEQINHVQNILNELNITQHKFTLREKITPSEEYGGLSEREFLLQKFAEGTYQVLVAIRCLDEGVDVPAATTAIILMSSSNPREWIQRRGRVLRRFPGKEKAIIYDVIVVPALSWINNSSIEDLERKIFYKELIRYKEFAEIAVNSLECLNNIYKIEKKLWEGV